MSSLVSLSSAPSTYACLSKLKILLMTKLFFSKILSSYFFLNSLADLIFVFMIYLYYLLPMSHSERLDCYHYEWQNVLFFANF